MLCRFRNRVEAGRRLVEALRAYAGRADVLVLALPRGGVPVAYEVALALQAPLDVLLVRKLGVPGQEELAMGAIASGGIRVINEEVVDDYRIADHQIDRVSAAEQHELERRAQVYRGDRPAPVVTGRTVILIDDGLATGTTMRAAVTVVRAQHPAAIVVAVPVAAQSTCEALRPEVDDLVCVMTPEPFYAIGLWYHDFTQTTDQEVCRLLAQAAQTLPELAAEPDVQLDE